AAFRDSQIYAHVGAAESLQRTAEHQRSQVVEHLRRTERPELAETYVATEVVLPFYLVEREVTPIDLGERTAYLLFGGRGHTDHDLVVAVPDVATVFWADLVEQGADPAMDDSYPLEWGATLAALQQHPQVREAIHHVPGHGDVVDTDFVTAQCAILTALAAELTAALESGVHDVDGLIAKTRGLGLQDGTLRDAAVRTLEVRSGETGAKPAR